MSAPVAEPPTTEAPVGSPPGRWRGLLMPVNVASGDKRLATLVGEDVPQRPLPLPLSAQYKLDNGHNGSVVIGLIERLWVQDNAVWGEGSFDLADPVAADWAAKVGRGVAGWISSDLSDVAITEVPLDEHGNDITTAFEEWLRADPDSVDPEPPVKSWLYRIDQWKMMGATLLSSPAFEVARIEPVYDGTALLAAGEDHDDEPATHTGAMVALVPAAEDAGRLAVEGGEPVEELHLTLAYLGEAAEWTPEQADAVYTAAADLLSGPVLGEVWGHASFNPNSTDKDPCAVYLAGADGLAELHAAVVGAVRDTGGPVPDQHSPWIPHITAGYGLDVAQLSETGPIRFDRLRVAFGGKARDIPLESVTAALTAAAVVFDRADFMAPEPDELTAITVTDDGRVFGHLAEYGSCHIGFADVCVTPPTSSSDYAYFHQGEISTDAGPLAVGKITLGTGHASMRASAKVAAAHYDNTGSAVAVVRCRDGALGPWLSGRLLPGVEDDRVDELRRSGVSGDWRGVRRGSRDLELVAVLAVNVPGFPVPRTRALAAAGVRSLVAAGVRRGPVAPPVHSRRLVLADVMRRRRRASLSKRMQAARLSLVTARMARFARERRVRTPEGARRYGVPIGSPIPTGRRRQSAPEDPERIPVLQRPPNYAGMPTVRELMQLEPDELLQQVQAGMNGRYGGLRLSITQADLMANGTEIDLRGSIQDLEGYPVGEIHRSIYEDVDGDLMVENHLMQIHSEEHRGRGFSSAYFAETLEYYRRSGVAGITLHASLNDGGWAWARAGFDWHFGPPQTHWNRTVMLSRLTNVRREVSGADRATINGLIDTFTGDVEGWPSPRTLSDLTGETPDLGRQIMHGSDWYGVMFL